MAQLHFAVGLTLWSSPKVQADNLPTMTASTHTHNVWHGGQLAGIGNMNQPVNQAYQSGLQGFSGNAITTSGTITGAALNTFVQPLPYKDLSPMMNGKGKLRVVRVFLVDPDERVPVEKRMLHRTEEITTDATDQELFFDIPVSDLLKTHNLMRASVTWEEKTTDGTKSRVGLKEVRIRDLIMSVTTIAEFQGRHV